MSLVFDAITFVSLTKMGFWNIVVLMSQGKGGKQDKMIPNLIFAIEEVERHLVKLGKKAKVAFAFDFFADRVCKCM